MHIHPPKPLHGWREFIGEVGIIVLGVLIALAAEQLVETVHWHDRVRDAKTSMVRELGYDNGAQALARIAISPCIDGILAQIEDHVTGVAGPLHLPAQAGPAFRTWDSDAWRAAQASGATSHMSTNDMYDWSAPYTLMDAMNQAQIREYRDWAPLIRPIVVPAQGAAGQRERLLAAIADARRDNGLLTFMARLLMQNDSDLRIGVPPMRGRDEIERQRSFLGNCHPKIVAAEAGGRA